MKIVSIEDTLRREVFEETHLRNITNLCCLATEAIRIPTQNGDVGLIFALFSCELEGEESVHLSEEHSSFSWTSPEKAAVFQI